MKGGKAMKRIIIICACVVFAAVLVFFGTKVLAPTPENPTLTSTAPDHFTVDYYEDFGYILTTPKNATENMPLIVYLHSSSGKGSDPNKLLQLPGFPKSHVFGELQRIDAYVLIPQLPADEAGWERVKPELIRLIDKVAADCKADATRISLTGHSMGATGAWKLAASYPEKFSCLVPICGSIANLPVNHNALKNMPIWAITSNADTVVPPSYTTEFMDALQLINSSCSVTVLDGVTHEDAWQVYKATNPSIFEWMLSQQSKSTADP